MVPQQFIRHHQMQHDICPKKTVRAENADNETKEKPMPLSCDCRCADILFSLEELGFCVSPLEEQRGNLSEYHEYVAEGMA